MATLKTIKNKIKDTRHLAMAVQYAIRKFGDEPYSPNNLPDYIYTKPDGVKTIQYNTTNEVDNTNKKIKCYCASFVSCTLENCIDEWEITRKLWNQNDGILVHQFSHSFSPKENITPEQAHKIAVEFAEKCFQGFQFAVMTHTDKPHLHSHIFVNNCNLVTGLKWSDNKASMKYLREQNDQLCKSYGFLPPSNEIQYIGVNRESMEATHRVASWKIPIVQSLSNVLNNAKDKNDFILRMEELGYQVKYRDTYITITDEQNNKVRVDNLAKQFGDFFKKENIDKKLGVKKKIQPNKQQNNKTFKQTEEKAKQNYNAFVFKQKNERDKITPILQNQSRRNGQLISETTRVAKEKERLENSIMRTAAFSARSKSLLPKVILYIALSIKLGELKLRKRLSKLNDKYKVFQEDDSNDQIFKMRKVQMKTTQYSRMYGNINYDVLTQSPGNNIGIFTTPDVLPKLLNGDIYYSAKITKNGKVSVTIKEDTLERFKQLTGIDVIIDNRTVAEVQRDKQKAARAKHNKENYIELKKTSQFIRSEIIDSTQLASIEKSDIVMCAVPVKNNESLFTLLFNDKDFAKVMQSIYPKRMINQTVGSKDYKALKIQEEKSGMKLGYRTVTKSELTTLKLSGAIMPCSVFYDSEKNRYNLAFENKYRNTINNVLKLKDNLNKIVPDNNAQLQILVDRIAQDFDNNVKEALSISDLDAEKLLKSGLPLIVSKSPTVDGRYDVTYPSAVSKQVEKIIEENNNFMAISMQQ